MAGGAGAQRAQHVRPPGNFNGGNSDNQQQPTPLNNGNQNPNNGGRQNTGPAGYGGFDGPTDGSGTPRQNPFGPGLGFDPAKPAKKESVITNTRVELPASAYLLNKEYQFPSELPARPGYNTNGKQIQIRVNQFKVTKYPTQDVWQYDIAIGNGAEKRGLVKRVWEARSVQAALKTLSPIWLWNGNKIAWCAKQATRQLKLMVDLDADYDRPPRSNGKKNECLCIISCTKPVRMAAIAGYLSKQMAFDDSVLEAINFLDHLMRQWPSEQYTVQKRNFFSRGQQRTPLDNVVEAFKGVYASMRLCDPNPSTGGQATGLAVNVDVANGTFWISQDVHQAARNLCKDRNRRAEYNIFRDLLMPQRDRNGRPVKSDDFKTLEKMKKLKFHVKHRGKAENKKEYTIKRFTWNDKDPKYAKDGVNAKNCTFKDRDGREQSVFSYFQAKYNVTLQFWQLPLIETEKAGFFPMELCTLIPNQKYQYKLSPEQTASMIKFAVTRPPTRLQSINHGIGMLKWHEDPYLKHFGTQIDQQMSMTNARLLQPPEIQYKSSKANPGTSGRWDLRGKKFFLANSEPLKSWGVCVVHSCIPEAAVRNFLNVFIQTYIGHGGVVQNKNPVIYMHERGGDVADAVVATRTAAGNQSQSLPQILMFVLPGRDSFMYERLKKNMECRFAMFSQMMNVAHIQKAQPQYCSNVCMKFNAKLGGTTCKVADAPRMKSFFPRSTMIIGADVSHPSPGSPQPSMAAITMSFDKEACRYAATVQTNGFRTEMITSDTIKTCMIPLFSQWCTKVGGGKGPDHIYYFRDGVSEGQYQHVLDQEVVAMKAAIREKFGPVADNIKWTVTVCVKRHHIRFFPKENDSQAGDKNGNALPGTLVERDVTHPFEYDFYLSSHSAIQGTARPVRYQVIQDEAKCDVNEFQRLIYQQCYQYMRSTTPVSLFPAVYYAHLASNRARAHESAPASDGPRGGQKFIEAQQAAAGRVDNTSTSGSAMQPTEARPLLPLGNPDSGASGDIITKIRTGMWYI